MLAKLSAAVDLHVYRTSNNFNQLSSDDGLPGSVEENLEFINHFSSVLRGVLHGLLTGGLFTGVTFCESPVDGVCESVLAEVAELFIVDFEGGEVCYAIVRSLLFEQNS